ncbi:MAG: PAS domain-containing protein [Proteobacteria bacterium]|nr:PAS domain-containing protein [Pseudomonadota bacterium]MCP4920512.1 PAS domain-containing protein [Pseudomonadota bacterium]
MDDAGRILGELPLGIAVVDEQGGVVDANPAATTLLGIDPMGVVLPLTLPGTTDLDIAGK